MLAFPEMLKSLTPVKGVFKKGSSFRKHFFEKIGDLLAIILSIYLALSIEGWAEKRHEYERLMKYYENLIHEIEEDTATLNKAIISAEMHIANTEKQIRWLKSYRTDLVDSISDCMSSMTTSHIFYSSNMITFRSMQMGGDIKLIDNLALRDSLIKLDDRYINVRLNEDLYIEYIKNDLLVAIKENFDLVDSEMLDDEFYTKPKYHNLVYFFQSLNGNRLNAYHEALPKAINTMEILKKELAKNK
ncbi:MAG: hypothetical protein R6X09_03380 [Bacteroidales bacterium]